MSKARRMASQGRETLSDATSEVTHRLHDVADSALHAASSAVRRGGRVARHSARDLEHYVEEHPVRTTLFALGIGCLIAAMLVRR